MHEQDCTGDYECAATEHASGCLSHTIDPPTETTLAIHHTGVEDCEDPDEHVGHSWVSRSYGTVWCPGLDVE